MRAGGTGSNGSDVSASTIASCVGTGTGARSGCLKQARMR